MLRVMASIIVCFSVAAAARAGTTASPEEFFIVSSIDAGRSRLVLKRPTEVTVIMRVSNQTSYRSSQGKRLQLSDLRAGDTAYITFSGGNAGEPVALSVRLGPMTVNELHRRYLKAAP